MNDQELKLTEDIMRRVRFIHATKLLLSPKMIKALVFLASSASFLFMVSIVHVIENMSRLPSVFAYADYFLASYLKTSFAVQAAVLLALAAGVWLVRDIIHGWSSQRSFARS